MQHGRGVPQPSPDTKTPAATAALEEKKPPGRRTCEAAGRDPLGVEESAGDASQLTTPGPQSPAPWLPGVSGLSWLQAWPGSSGPGAVGGKEASGTATTSALSGSDACLEEGTSPLGSLLHSPVSLGEQPPSSLWKLPEKSPLLSVGASPALSSPASTYEDIDLSTPVDSCTTPLLQFRETRSPVPHPGLSEDPRASGRSAPSLLRREPVPHRPPAPARPSVGYFSCLLPWSCGGAGAGLQSQAYHTGSTTPEEEEEDYTDSSPEDWLCSRWGARWSGAEAPRRSSSPTSETRPDAWRRGGGPEATTGRSQQGSGSAANSGVGISGSSGRGKSATGLGGLHSSSRQPLLQSDDANQPVSASGDFSGTVSRVCGRLDRASSGSNVFKPVMSASKDTSSGGDVAGDALSSSATKMTSCSFSSTNAEEGGCCGVGTAQKPCSESPEVKMVLSNAQGTESMTSPGQVGTRSVVQSSRGAACMSTACSSEGGRMQVGSCGSDTKDRPALQTAQGEENQGERNSSGGRERLGPRDGSDRRPPPNQEGMASPGSAGPPPPPPCTQSLLQARLSCGHSSLDTLQSSLAPPECQQLPADLGQPPTDSEERPLVSSQPQGHRECMDSEGQCLDSRQLSSSSGLRESGKHIPEPGSLGSGQPSPDPGQACGGSGTLQSRQYHHADLGEDGAGPESRPHPKEPAHPQAVEALLHRSTAGTRQSSSHQQPRSPGKSPSHSRNRRGRRFFLRSARDRRQQLSAMSSSEEDWNQLFNLRRPGGSGGSSGGAVSRNPLQNAGQSAPATVSGEGEQPFTFCPPLPPGDPMSSSGSLADLSSADTPAKTTGDNDDDDGDNYSSLLDDDSSCSDCEDLTTVNSACPDDVAMLSDSQSVTVSCVNGTDSQSAACEYPSCHDNQAMDTDDDCQQAASVLLPSCSVDQEEDLSGVKVGGPAVSESPRKMLRAVRHLDRSGKVASSHPDASLDITDALPQVCAASEPDGLQMFDPVPVQRKLRQPSLVSRPWLPAECSSAHSCDPGNSSSRGVPTTKSTSPRSPACANGSPQIDRNSFILSDVEMAAFVSEKLCLSRAEEAEPRRWECRSVEDLALGGRGANSAGAGVAVETSPALGHSSKEAASPVASPAVSHSPAKPLQREMLSSGTLASSSRNVCKDKSAVSTRSDINSHSATSTFLPGAPMAESGGEVAPVPSPASLASRASGQQIAAMATATSSDLPQSPPEPSSSPGWAPAPGCRQGTSLPPTASLEREDLLPPAAAIEGLSETRRDEWDTPRQSRGLPPPDANQAAPSPQSETCMSEYSQPFSHAVSSPQHAGVSSREPCQQPGLEPNPLQGHVTSTEARAVTQLPAALLNLRPITVMALRQFDTTTSPSRPRLSGGTLCRQSAEVGCPSRPPQPGDPAARGRVPGSHTSSESCEAMSSQCAENAENGFSSRSGFPSRPDAENGCPMEVDAAEDNPGPASTEGESGLAGVGNQDHPDRTHSPAPPQSADPGGRSEGSFMNGRREDSDNMGRNSDAPASQNGEETAQASVSVTRDLPASTPDAGSTRSRSSTSTPAAMDGTNTGLDLFSRHGGNATIARERLRCQLASMHEGDRSGIAPGQRGTSGTRMAEDFPQRGPGSRGRTSPRSLLASRGAQPSSGYSALLARSSGSSAGTYQLGGSPPASLQAARPSVSSSSEADPVLGGVRRLLRRHGFRNGVVVVDCGSDSGSEAAESEDEDSYSADDEFDCDCEACAALRQTRSNTGNVESAGNPQSQSASGSEPGQNDRSSSTNAAQGGQEEQQAAPAGGGPGGLVPQFTMEPDMLQRIIEFTGSEHLVGGLAVFDSPEEEDIGSVDPVPQWLADELIWQSLPPVGLSSAALSRLPISAAAEGDVGRTCVICQQEVVLGEELTRLLCIHCFHQQCLQRWLARADSCPICRRKVE